MHVYSSLLRLLDQDPRPAVRAAFRAWLEQKLRKKLRDEQLLQGRHDLGRGHLLEIEHFEYHEDPPPKKRPPERDWATALRYSHPDREVHGRRWITEVGLSLWNGKNSSATIRLSTEEQSALANVPISTTKPRIAQMILEACRLHAKTPGKTVQPLRTTDADAFAQFARDTQRRHPIVVVSHAMGGGTAVPVADLAAMLVGIADVALIPRDEDTRALQRALPNGMCPYLGAINILWPPSSDGEFSRVARTTLLPEHLEELRRQGKDVAAELMARVCHETNRDIGAWHVDIIGVRQLRQRLDLDLTRERLARSATPEQRELLGIYIEVEKEDKERIAALKQQVEALNAQLTAARSDSEEANAALRKAEGKASSLEAAIDEAKRANNRSAAVDEVTRQALRRAIDGQPSLVDCLHLLEHVFPEQVVVLPTAWKSAEDAKKFQHGAKALDLLWKLCGDYHNAIAKGGSDRKAVDIFGNTSFAARESETVENNKKARALRSFSYKGESVEMMRHLKIGVKQSDATTFRCHFHWDADDQVIVIGHCGGHLDHD